MLAAFGSLGADFWLARHLRSNTDDVFWTRLLFDTADAALWGSSGTEDPSSVRWIINSSITGSALEAAFRFAADDNSVPPAPPKRLISVPGHAARVVDAGVRLSAPTLMPFLAMKVARRRLQRPMATGEWLGFGLFATGGGALLARRRNRLQALAREEWQERATQYLEWYDSAARAEVSATAADAHNFKKCLTWLGTLGSAPAAELAKDQLDWPRRRLGQLNGKTLRMSAGIPVEPVTAWPIWLHHAQVDELNRFIDWAEQEPLERDGVLRVQSYDGTALRVRCWGHEKLLALPVPLLERSLEPLGTILVVGIAWKLMTATAVMGKVPLRLIAPAVAADATLARRHASTRHGELLPNNSVLMGSVLSSALLALATTRSPAVLSRTPGGLPVFPQTGQLLSTTALIGHYWRPLRSLRWLAVGSVIATWTYAAWHPGDRSIIEVLAEFIVLLQVLAATLGLGDRVADEAALLERHLRSEFEDRIEANRRAAAVEEIVHYRTQLDVARVEFARIQESISDDDRCWFERECEALEEWLKRAAP